MKKKLHLNKKKKLRYKINLKNITNKTHYISCYINATFNNTIINVTDQVGNTLYICSGGQVGFKGSKRSTAYAAEVAGQIIGKKLIQIGIEEVRVLLKGIGKGRKSSLKGLKSSGLKIIFLKDITPFPYNGCRLKKKRRL